MKSFLSFKTIDEQINEVLSKDADAGAWISDFVKSDDPKFAGKSEAKRKQMALAAYYAKQKNESNDAYGASLEKKKEDRLSSKDQDTLGKVRDMLAKEKKPAKNEAVKQVRGDTGLQYEETELDEASRAETGELFKGLVDKAHASSQAGNHTQAKRHLANAQTARYGILAKHMNKHQASFDKYKELKHSYTNSDEPVREEAEELDELSKGTLKSYVNKAAQDLHTKAMTAGMAAISPKNTHGDVYKSNYSKSFKRQTGIANAANKLAKEEVEELDELSNKLLNRYSKKAEKEAGKHFMAADRAQDRGNYDKAQTNMDKAEKRASGVYRAQSKIKEESLDEISKDTLSSYANKAFAQGNDLHYDLAHSKGNKATDAERQAIKDKISKRNAGVIKAAQKMNKEDMDEAVDTVKRDEKGKVIAWSHEGDWQKMSSKNKQGSGKAANLAGKAMQKTKQLSKEEVEEDINESAWGKDKMSSLRQAHDRHMEKALAANRAGDDEATKTHQRKMQMIQGKMQKLKQNEEVELGEECEILAELDKKTLGNYVNKAHDQLMKHTGTVNMKYGRGDKDATAYALDKDALRKTANRTQGMKTALNKLTKEEVEEFMQTEAYEQLDELDKDTLKSYIGKASQNARIQGMMQMDYKHKGEKARNPGTKKAYDKMSDDARSKGWKRQDGIKTAANKLAKEDTMLTYSEFMAQLAEGKADDLRDKLAADREARLNNYDYSKEKDNKKSPVQKVKGHSYGAGEEEGESDDDNTVKTAKPAAVKRGRGRPVGTKSGARV
jgi:hypothetical protein